MNDLIKNAYSNSRRYVIDEDSIPKVTSDGEPHEIMTMVAAFSGIIAAVIVLIILIMLIGCRNSNRNTSQSNTEDSANKNRNGVVIIPVFDRHKVDGSSNLMRISTISETIGYDNPACETQAMKINSSVLTGISLPEITTARC